LAQSFYELLAYNFLMGVGIAIWMITGMAMIADNVSPSMRGKVTTTYQAVNMIGTMIGPVIGGLISQLTNSYRACFFIFAASASVSMVAAMILVQESAPSQRQENNFPIKDNLRKLLSLLSFPILMATFMVFTSHIRYAAWGTFLPLYGGDILRLSAGEIGLIMSISTFTNLLTYSPAGYIIDKYGRKVALIPSFIITAFSFIALPLVNNFVGIVLVAALLGIASGLSSATWALAADLSPKDMRGFFVGFWHTFGDVGMIIGPIILGLIADSYGYALSFYTVAGLMFLTAATSQLFVKETLERVEQKKSH
jgi:MFS family permease